MIKTTETQIALHEQRLTTLENAYPRFESKIDQILERLDTRVVSKIEYEKDVKDQKDVNKFVEAELETIKSTMVTKSQMADYSRSQFWQKVLTFLGGIGYAILIAVVLYEVNKLIK
jgi:chromosome segregation ATPase